MLALVAKGEDRKRHVGIACSNVVRKNVAGEDGGFRASPGVGEKRNTQARAFNPDREHGGRGIAVGVGDRVGVGVGFGFTCGKVLGLGVIQGIGVAAVDVEDERAVREGDGDRGDGVGAHIGTGFVVIEDIAGKRVAAGIFSERGGGSIILRFGNVINNIDDKIAAGDTAGAPDSDGENVGRGVRTGLVDRSIQGVAVIQPTGGRIETGESQYAGTGVDGEATTRKLGRGERGAANGEFDKAARRGEGEEAAGGFAGISGTGQATFLDRQLAKDDTVGVINSERGGGIGIPAAAFKRVVQRCRPVGAEFEIERIDAFGNPHQAHEGRAAACITANVTGGGFFEQFIKAAAFLDGLNDFFGALATFEQGGIGGVRFFQRGDFGIKGQGFVGRNIQRAPVLHRQLDAGPHAGDQHFAFVDRVVKLQLTQIAFFVLSKNLALQGSDAGDGGVGCHDFSLIRSE